MKIPASFRVLVVVYFYLHVKWYQNFQTFTGKNTYNEPICIHLETSKSSTCRAQSNLSLIILPFEIFIKDAFNGMCGQQDPEFALVIPTRIYGNVKSALSPDALSILLSILRSHDWLNVIAGHALVLGQNERPACRMAKNQRTLHLSENYSKFTDGSTRISISTDECDLKEITCYPCDLLPDIFVIKISAFRNLDHPSWKKLSSLTESARIPLFLKFPGQSAYCPQVKLLEPTMQTKASFDITCNQLRIPWDDRFVFLPRVLGIYRLIFQYPNGTRVQYWLGCTWSQIAHESGSPLHCSNWVRQFLYDIVDVLDQVNVDYRLIEGSLIGAMRQGDVIPWSPDADIVVFAPRVDQFRMKFWYRLWDWTNGRYTHLDRSGLTTVTIFRAFPSCPVRLTDWTEIHSDNQLHDIIKRSKNAKAAFSHHQSWRSTGYFDAYPPRSQAIAHSDFADHFWCADQIGPGKFSYVRVGKRQFKTVPDPLEYLNCFYGSTWNETPPSLKGGWNSYSDNVS